MRILCRNSAVWSLAPVCLALTDEAGGRCHGVQTNILMSVPQCCLIHVVAWTKAQPCPASIARRLSDRKSTRLNSSHGYNSYAGFCLEKKKSITTSHRHLTH